MVFRRNREAISYYQQSVKETMKKLQPVECNGGGEEGVPENITEPYKRIKFISWRHKQNPPHPVINNELSPRTFQQWD